MNKPVVSIRNLSKRFPNGVQALKDINFDVEKGEFLAVIGSSGSGKSTLLRSINRLHEPTSGEIYFEGESVLKEQSFKSIQKLRMKIGMIFQHFNLVPRQSVLKNVLMGRLAFKSTWSSLIGSFTQAETDEAISNLNLVGIADLINMRADHLSGGQKQRVAIARALMQRPILLLADEPVASLDPATCYLVMDYLKKINTELGITVIVNLHFLSLVKKYSTRVIGLKKGEIVFNGKPEDLNEQWFEKIYGEGVKDVSSNHL